MKHLMKMITIFLLISIFLSSCEKEKYVYSDKLELGATLFNLSTNEIKAISCRINSESIDSFFSPPVLEPSYKIVGIIYLEDTYKLLNADQSEKKNMMVQYPSNNTIRDWSTSTKWSDELIKDGVRGEVYYSHSQHAFYFEVYK